MVSQASGESFPEFVENTRWSHEGIIFATVHLIGSMNGLDPFPGRTATDDAEAKAANASAVVLGFHGNPSFEEAVDDPDRQAFEPFMLTLEEEVEAFPKPVLAVPAYFPTVTSMKRRN